jgi:pimeloyl-ACP methyl ester carboxylesterase
MSAFARLVRFDKRGTGLSDRPSGAQPVEQRMQDAIAVLDAAGLDSAHVLGWSDGGALALLLAARHPDRVSSLAVYGTQACFHNTPDYPWGGTAEDVGSGFPATEEEWGDFAFAAYFAPSGDSGFAERWAAYQRAGASPSAAAELNRMNTALDVRDVLPHIRVPTLVLARRGDRIGPPAPAADLAERIDRARFVELPGDDHIMWLGDVETLCSEIERFVLSVASGRQPPVRHAQH